MKRNESLPARKRTRLKDYDYSQPGYYFVTVCTKQRCQILWAPVGATCGRPPLSAWGSIVEEELIS